LAASKEYAPARTDNMMSSRFLASISCTRGPKLML
jgi:hypothetical protein